MWRLLHLKAAQLGLMGLLDGLHMTVLKQADPCFCPPRSHLHAKQISHLELRRK